MAEPVNKMPPRRTQALYPWDQWLDGQVWQLTEHHDFQVPAVSFRATAQTEAYRRGLRLVTRVDGHLVYIQATERGE